MCELGLATGVVSLWALALPAIGTLPMMPKALGGVRWKRTERMGYLCLALVAGHMVVFGIKGDGEAHPFLSPNDEFADYETWDKANLEGSELKKKEMLQYEYARSALRIGLQLEKELGINPFKFGMIGSTDAHTAISSIEEDNFFGKHSGVEPEPDRWKHLVISSALDPNLTVLAQ